jgi:short-subunit dehydrogenase involved in D-alanine esterification of teichoic acids
VDVRRKAVLITGCDSGFGYELALKCVRDGMDVFATCFTEEVCLIGFLKGSTGKYSIIKGTQKTERMLCGILKNNSD